MISRLVFLLLVSGLFCCTVEASLAQATSGKRNQPSRYFLGEEEQMLLPVNILGMVQNPGQYMVPFRTDLVSLIAYAGGFRENAKITDVKIVRNIRANGQSRSKTNGTQSAKSRVFRVDIKRFFETGDQSHIPQLMPDDTVLVGGSTAQKVNKAFDYISKLVILGQLAFYVTIALERR